MNLLLDTHVLLWWLDDPALLSEGARLAIKNSQNSVFVSAAVIWELIIKRSLGKVEMPDNLEKVMEANGFQSLPVSVPHALTVGKLPNHHRDPFDRMLIAQAISEGLTLTTRDTNILKYPVSYLMA